jgi:hypothetical protein
VILGAGVPRFASTGPQERLKLAMTRFPQPSTTNRFLADHMARLQASLWHWTGRELIDSTLPAVEQARALFEAPFILVSHDTADDPVFNYGNRIALALWEMSWDEFTALPSRQSAEPMEQSARARLLAEVTTHGFITHYEGIRISRTGRRFLIQDALVWNLLDETDQPYGQAAMFSQWTFLA